MRIVIDMQGAQSESRFRGIGRYTMGFAQAVVSNRGEHEVFLALNSLFPEAIEPIRAAFDGLLPQQNIRVWHAPGPVCEMQSGNDARREAAELMREAFLASLHPDVVHVSSLFEGYVDDAVTSIGRFDTSTPVSVTLYDLIPLLNPKDYLKPHPHYEQYYLRKIEHLRRAALLLSISDFSRKEAMNALGIDGDRIVNVSGATDAHFQVRTIDEAAAEHIRRKLNISRAFVLYTGGVDERKNLARLIHAYAGLPTGLRAGHQLVFAGKMPEGDVVRLRRIADTAGLKNDELIFAGYISDEELVWLYNLCRLYVFPSCHEGFGLPALEAMRCGAPVIGANTSSLPEAIGLKEALFDPFDVSAIAAKIAQALEDDAFRAALREHGLQQVKKFSWDDTAKRAIAAWERLPSQVHAEYLDRSMIHQRLLESLAKPLAHASEPELVMVSNCLAKNRSAGIERQLLLDISELSQRNAATGVQRVVRSYLKWLLHSPPEGFRVEPVYATRDEGYRYARRYTQRFLGLSHTDVVDDPIRWQRGDVFFGLDMQHHVQLAQRAFYRQLRQDGVTVKFLVYDLLPIQLPDYFYDPDAKALHEQWLSMIATTDGAICISKATADAFEQWITDSAVSPAPTFQITWVHIGADIEGSAPSRGLPSDAEAVLDAIRSRPSFLSVSTLEPRKGHQQILDAMEQLWAQGVEANLVLVGQQGWKIEALADRIRSHPEQGKKLFWLQGISDEYLERVYAASTCLIAASFGEGFGLPLIEAARHGIPIVARDIPVFREVAGDCAYYFRGDRPKDLADALKTWLGLFQKKVHPSPAAMRWLTWQQSSERLKHALLQKKYPRRQLLVDISELVQRDAKTGIQRVVRSILKEWLDHPPEGYRVEPVYATTDQGYRYARGFTCRFLDIRDDWAEDEWIEPAPGDVFFGLDLQPQVQVAQRAFYQDLRRWGVHVLFLVHDLLCVRMPRYFPPGAEERFIRWLEVVAESDGAVCVSRAVAEELAEWVGQYGPSRLRPFKIDWFHHGADIENSAPSKGLPSSALTTLGQLSSRPSFLMVGTIEPRKAHAQVLAAFERLWAESMNANLVIVGNPGWMVEALTERLRFHPERDKRLFWLEGISDEYLEKIYAASTCLIAASYGEGFGLPLIEAARHKLPIIARDIPVFREVGGDHAYYFPNTTGTKGLADALKAWLSLYQQGAHPKSDHMPWLTWKQSAERLTRIILEDISSGTKTASAGLSSGGELAR